MPDLEVSLLVPGRTDLEAVVQRFESRWPGRYEVIVSENPMRGLALREAFSKSRGRVIMMLHPEQPCDPTFFVRAYDALHDGTALVRANRRLENSRFRIPVTVLPKVYARHRYGLAFNRLVRTLFPSVQTRDTSAGNLVMTRRLATLVFALQSRPGFLFDLEIAVIATDRGLEQHDIPEHLLLHREKTLGRIGSELWTILNGLPRLWWRHVRGYYRARPLPDAITADDWGMSPAINRAIVDLARRGIVGRVSMLADAPHLRDSLDDLWSAGALTRVEYGLHFDMKMPPGRFLLRWLTSRTAMGGTVRAELRRQLDALAAAGITATYIDGHQHVHIVPGFIAAIAPVLEERGIRTVRLPYDRSLWLTRLMPINVLSIFLRRDLESRGLQYRRVIYPQPKHLRDAARLRKHITRWPDAEVIVHPATERDFEDDYGSDRVREYRMLIDAAAAE